MHQKFYGFNCKYTFLCFMLTKLSTSDLIGLREWGAGPNDLNSFCFTKLHKKGPKQRKASNNFYRALTFFYLAKNFDSLFQYIFWD